MHIKHTYILLFAFVLAGKVNAQDSLTKDIPLPNSFNLGVHLNIGDTYTFHSTYQEKITQTIMGSPLEGNQDIVTTLLLEVSDIQENRINLITTIQHIEIENSTGVTPITYSSEDTTSGPMDYLNGLIGQSFLITINRQGKLLESETIQDLFNTVEADEGGILFGHRFIESIISNALYIYKDHTVEIGETWNNPENITVSRTLTIPQNVQYTLESLSEDLIWLNVSSTDNLNPQSIQGNYEIDRLTGLISYGTAHYEILEEKEETPAKIEIDHTIEISKQSD